MVEEERSLFSSVIGPLPVQTLTTALISEIEDLPSFPEPFLREVV